MRPKSSRFLFAVYVGSKVRPDQDLPWAHASRTLHPTGKVLCDADVAFIVLDRPIPNVTIQVLPFKVGGHAEDGVHPGRLVCKPLPIG